MLRNIGKQSGIPWSQSWKPEVSTSSMEVFYGNHTLKCTVLS